MLLRKCPRLPQRGTRAFLLVEQRRVERERTGDADDVQRVNRAAALLRELDRRREHLLADRPELDRDENPYVFTLARGNEIRHRRVDVLEQTCPPTLARVRVEGDSEQYPGGAADPSR